MVLSNNSAVQSQTNKKVEVTGRKHEADNIENTYPAITWIYNLYQSACLEIVSYQKTKHIFSTL
jgi:hypothetical protein